MNYIFERFQREIYTVVALMLIGATGGYTVSEIHNEPIDPYTQEINIRVSEVNAMMQDLIENPSKEAAEDINYQLRLQGNWSNRNYGEQKEAFEAYLEACNKVVIAEYKGSSDLSQKIAIMEEKKAVFN